MRQVFIWVLLVLAALVVGSATGCSHTPASEPTKIVRSPDPNVIDIGHPERFPLVEVESRDVADRLHVNGVVSPDVNRTVPVLSLSGGRVVDVRVRLGDDVKKGQVLLSINSPDLASAFSDLQKFRADEVLATKQMKRSELLYSRGAIAQKDLEAAEDAADKARVDLRTAEDRVRILGGNVNHPSPLLEVRAPISGAIVEQNVSGGSGVRSLDNSPNLFTIADLSRVWVLCDVYENSLSQVHLGDTAEVRVNALPDRAFTGRVSNISRVLDPNTRAAKVRIELDNPGRVMRSGMFVTASFISRQQQQRPVLPTSATLRMHDKDWVFVPLGGNRFRKTEVQLGRQVGDGLQEVLVGMGVHEKVVANALQFSSASESK